RPLFVVQKLRPRAREVRRRAIAVAAQAMAWAVLESRAVAAPVVTVPGEWGSTAALETGLRSRIGPRADAILEQTRLSISSDGVQYRLSMQVGAETRELRDPDCRHLFDAAVVIAASFAEGPAPRPPESAEAPPPASANPPA